MKKPPPFFFLRNLVLLTLCIISLQSCYPIQEIYNEKTADKIQKVDILPVQARSFKIDIKGNISQLPTYDTLQQIVLQRTLTQNKTSYIVENVIEVEDSIQNLEIMNELMVLEQNLYYKKKMPDLEIPLSILKLMDQKGNEYLLICTIDKYRHTTESAIQEVGESILVGIFTLGMIVPNNALSWTTLSLYAFDRPNNKVEYYGKVYYQDMNPTIGDLRKKLAILTEKMILNSSKKEPYVNQFKIDFEGN